MESIKLNYLLVIPRLVQKIGDGYSFPLGIAYISSSMKKAGYNVFTLNLNDIEGEVSEIVKGDIYKNAINVLARGGLSFQYNTIRQVLDAAKMVSESIVTIVGGGIITSDPTAAMEALGCADYGVIGEGEATIIDLCKYLENGGDSSEVDGIIFKKGKSHITTKPRKEIEDLDSLPWPDYEGFGLDKFLAAAPSVSGLNRKNTVFMIASRSCPYNCTFCFHSVGNKYRQRSLDDFFKELDYMVSRYKIDFICLADELFAKRKARVKEFCSRIKKYNIRWWAQFRIDSVTPELLPILKDGGCEVMSFGLESADDRILKSMRKGTTVLQIEKTLKTVYDAGVSMEGAFIFGDIEETLETANNTLNWWRDHSEYKINLNLITVYPGSYLYKYACDKGIIRDKVKFIRDGCPQVRVSKLSDSEFSELIKKIMEAPMTLAKVLSGVEVDAVDYERGRLDVKGVCTACRTLNRWPDIKLFTTNFIGCHNCGQRYNTVLPPKLRSNIDLNVRKLLDRYERIAVWGINYHTSDLFKNSTALSLPGVYPVDISDAKRKMNFYGKEIFDPDVISRERIKIVVIAIPVYFSQIEGQVRAN